MKDDDRELFRAMTAGVSPHKSSEKVSLRQRPNLQKKASARQQATQFTSPEQQDALTSVDYIDRVEPHQVLSFRRNGLQHNVFKNFRLGKLPLEADIDLHAHTVDQAREQLPKFIEACMREGLRVVLITHGHGAFREMPAVLKSCVNRWLQEMDAVIAFHSAQPKHGSTGATYVLLRKLKHQTEA